MGRMEPGSRSSEELVSSKNLDNLVKPKERDKHAAGNDIQNGPESDLCQQLSCKAALTDKTAKQQKINEVARKIRKYLHRVNRKPDCNKSTNQMEMDWASGLLKMLRHSGKLPGLHKVEESPLVERSPMRVSTPLHPHPKPYGSTQQRGYRHNGGMRVVESDSDVLENWLDQLTSPELDLFLRTLQQADTQENTNCNTTNLNQPWHRQTNEWATQWPAATPYQANINGNINEWESTHYEGQTHNTYREPRYSFSSTSSNSPYSESPASSPGSSPYSPTSTADLNLDDLIPTTVTRFDQLEASSVPCHPSPVTSYSSSDSSPAPSLLAGSPQTNVNMATPAKDRLAESLDPNKKNNAWVHIQKPSIDKLGSGDDDGDSQLMILLVQRRSPEFAYCVVERLLKEKPEYLAQTNNHEKDALRIAAEDLQTEPSMAAYIAEALARAELPVEKYYSDGETLLHKLSRLGTDYADVVKDLLEVRLMNGFPAFNVNARNKDGLTPLHLACSSHRPGEVDNSRTLQYLLDSNADILAQDYVDKNTPLHNLVLSSADLRLVNIIFAHLIRHNRLQQAAEVVNRQQNTVLHLACGKNGLSVVEHCKLVQTVFNHGGQIHLKNNNGQVPSYLVDISRKSEIKAILHGKLSKARH